MVLVEYTGSKIMPRRFFAKVDGKIKNANGYAFSSHERNKRQRMTQEEAEVFAGTRKGEGNEIVAASRFAGIVDGDGWQIVTERKIDFNDLLLGPAVSPPVTLPTAQSAPKAAKSEGKKGE